MLQPDDWLSNQPTPTPSPKPSPKPSAAYAPFKAEAAGVVATEEAEVAEAPAGGDDAAAAAVAPASSAALRGFERLEAALLASTPEPGELTMAVVSRARCRWRAAGAAAAEEAAEAAAAEAAEAAEHKRISRISPKELRFSARQISGDSVIR